MYLTFGKAIHYFYVVKYSKKYYAIFMSWTKSFCFSQQLKYIGKYPIGIKKRGFLLVVAHNH